MKTISNRLPVSMMRKGPAAVVVSALTLALCLAPQAEAQGGFNGPGRYQVVNVKSGKVLDLDPNDQKLVNLYEPHTDRAGQQFQGLGFGQSPSISIEQATDQFVAVFQQSNRNMRVVRHHDDISVDGQSGLSTYLSNDSPAPGRGRETNWLVTLPHSSGLLFLVFTAPERDFQSYEQTFEQMRYSVRARR